MVRILQYYYYSAACLLVRIILAYLAGMTSSIRATELDLQCNHDQIVCPLQNITCQCVVEGTEPTLVWKLQSSIVAQFDSNATSFLPPTNFEIISTATAQGNEISSTMSFTAQLQYNLMNTVTMECSDNGTYPLSSSYAYTKKPGPPVIDTVLSLNSSSAVLYWTPPLYNCSLAYPVQVAERNGPLILSNTTNATSLTVTNLETGKVFSFSVASMDAAGRVSDWSEPRFLLLQG